VVGGLGLDDLFEALIDSEAVGAKKPEPAIFQAAMRPMGAEPAATLMVGDSLRRDREGALRAGLDFVWIAPLGEQERAGHDGRRHRAVHRLDGLLDLLL
jgi:putative hydrolase of the HAD superfamily